jgi:uroporphyrinogen-III synthase
LALVTRPEPGASDTTRRLEILGWSALWGPCLVIEPRRLKPAPHVQAVLVTSSQALPALQSWHGTPLFAVGDATASRAVRAGFTQVETASGDAAALHDLVRARRRPAEGPLLLASGRGQGAELATQLRQNGFSVLRRIAYAAHPAAALPDEVCFALNAGRIKVALFFSTETARVFARILPAALQASLASVDAVVIAPAVSAAVRHLPWHAVRVALRPSQDEMLALLP